MIWSIMHFNWRTNYEHNVKVNYHQLSKSEIRKTRICISWSYYRTTGFLISARRKPCVIFFFKCGLVWRLIKKNLDEYLLPKVLYIQYWEERKRNEGSKCIYLRDKTHAQKLSKQNFWKRCTKSEKRHLYKV